MFREYYWGMRYEFDYTDEDTVEEIYERSFSITCFENELDEKGIKYHYVHY